MDPFMDNDPWMVRDAKGKAKPAPVTFGDFLPPGFSQIEPDSNSPKVESAPFGGPYNEEFAKIELALEESLSDSEKRELALQRAISAKVPWRKERNLSKMDIPGGKMPIPSGMFKFGASYNKCSCSDSNCQEGGF